MKEKKIVRTALIIFLFFIASFMNWGSFQANPFQEFSNNLGLSFGNMNMTCNLNGWNSNLSIFGVSINNWIVVLLGIAIAIFIILDIKSIYSANKTILFVFIIYGIVHITAFGVFLLSKGKLGIGIILTLITYIFLFILCKDTCDN